MNERIERNYLRGLLHGQVIAYRNCGFSLREISEMLQNRISYSGISRVLRRIALHGLHVPHRVGRPRITIARTNCLLV